MKILEALLHELKRLDSLPQEEFDREMQANEDFGILVFAAKDELRWVETAVQVPVWQKDVEDKARVEGIIDRVLGGKSCES